MRLLGILVYRWRQGQDPVQLSSHLDLSSINFFQRSTVKELVVFHSRMICARTPLSSRQSVEFQQGLGFCHSYVSPTGLAATCLSDTEYPMRVAFSLLSQVLRIFQDAHATTWEAAVEDTQLKFPEGDELLKAYQNPMEADKLCKVQKDLDEVKDVMLKNIDELLARGETLDSLMQKSNDLSNTSYEFYRTAKQNNQCCKWY